MAKSKKRKKPEKKQAVPSNTNRIVRLSNKMINHMRYEQGGMVVVDKIKDYNEDEIIILSYIKTSHEKARKLSAMYDKMLLDAKLNEKLYLEKRSEMVKQVGDYIIENNLYREWMDLILIVSENIQTDSILNAYLSEMMDTWRELSSHTPGKLICGINSDGELLYVNDHFGDWDIPLLEFRYKIERKILTQEQFQEQLPKFRYLDKVSNDENLWAIQLFDMMPFINERTYKVIPKEPLKDYSSPYWKMPKKWLSTPVYKEAITKREYMIGRKGIRVKFLNAGDIQELFLMEDMDRNNELVMIYQLSIKGLGSLNGFYRARHQSFFSTYVKTSEPAVHEKLENFVLSVYADIVSSLDKERFPAFRLEETDLLENAPVDRPENRIYYQYISSTKTKDEGNSESGLHTGNRSQRPHLRSFALRKLGDSHEASAEAKQRALEYGIELKEGYTFVRGYEVGKKKI